MKLRALLFASFTFTLLFTFSTGSFCQDLRVENVTFEQIGEKIVVRYDLTGQTDKVYKVSLLLSDNSGISYSIEPKTLSGNVGKGITPGKNKYIVWDYTKDFPDGLEGDRFVFAVDAELQSGGGNALYYLLGAGAIGGIVYFVTNKLKEDEPAQPTTGSITISIPGDF